MNLRDFLKNVTRVGDIVSIREHGWQIGMTRIDNDDLYLRSLNPVILDHYNVVYFASENMDWAIDDVIVVEILNDQGVGNNE